MWILHHFILFSDVYLFFSVHVCVFFLYHSLSFRFYFLSICFVYLVLHECKGLWDILVLWFVAAFYCHEKLRSLFLFTLEMSVTRNKIATPQCTRPITTISQNKKSHIIPNTLTKGFDSVWVVVFWKPHQVSLCIENKR